MDRAGPGWVGTRQPPSRRTGAVIHIIQTKPLQLYSAQFSANDAIKRKPPLKTRQSPKQSPKGNYTFNDKSTQTIIPQRSRSQALPKRQLMAWARYGTRSTAGYGRLVKATVKICATLCGTGCGQSQPYSVCTDCILTMTWLPYVYDGSNLGTIRLIPRPRWLRN